ncbi:response regulator [uncultured Chitinophaga sp.]|jgi:Response regulators consisting of a CheY-like receiver domain and a winged-helix DNA-binding domain|uniref:response regulator n=1 Tax=uncultured Chitinophaga sp. TaxID=339340 RepID=UPI0026064B58|nr:response regulator [uncultured Chitinophaga sp.]
MKKLIIIDDDPGILDVLKLVLGENYHVVTYPDGTAIQNGTFDPPDLFVFDKQLAGADGLDLCRLLKQNNDTRHIPVIIISAVPGIKDMAAAAGADDVLEKPFRVKTLRERIAGLLGVQQQVSGEA